MPNSTLTEARGFQTLPTPGSSNVHSFRFSPEIGEGQARRGTLYVTFLGASKVAGKTVRAGKGPTYAYKQVPITTYTRFRSKARGRSAGKAVWDYLRVRGSRRHHQFIYFKVNDIPIPIPSGGYPVEFIPRGLTVHYVNPTPIRLNNNQ